ncbi:MAG TPA: sigma-70 family RNA polymerase sigma factor, partial [Solirubrobacteraceae bacterium]
MGVAGLVGRDADDTEARIAALVAEHGAALMRVARHFSLCADDAHDAYQRALEIYLRRVASIDARTEGAWMRVVVRHEAMAVRRARSAAGVSDEEVDLDARPDDESIAVEDRLFRAERSARSAEALRRLKPDEATALLLKAEGHTYDEIAARHGWTYTKVNRAITEGRRRFLKTYAELEAGEGCEPFRPALAALAAGHATAEVLMELRPHLRHCPACRATVRELRGGRRRAAAWLPWPFAAVLARGGDAPLDLATNAVEAAGAPLAPSPVTDPGRWAQVKLHVQNLLHRVSGS